MEGSGQSGKVIRVGLVAPSMTCWGLERLVQSAEPRMSHVGSIQGLDEADAVLALAGAHVVVVDLEGCAQLSWLEGARERLGARLLLLTSSQDAALLDAAVLAGAQGIVRKSEPAPLLLRAIEKVHEGELWIDRTATGRIFMEMARRKATEREDPEQMKIASLTPREREMIAAVAADTSAPGKVIASRLCISEHTLRNHLSAIYSKLGLANRVDLYAYATRHRLDRVG